MYRPSKYVWVAPLSVSLPLLGLFLPFLGRLHSHLRGVYEPASRVLEKMGAAEADWAHIAVVWAQPLLLTLIVWTLARAKAARGRSAAKWTAISIIAASVIAIAIPIVYPF